jgi:hypothetical protein
MMNFGQAIEAMKAEQRVRRIGWNGKGMYIRLVRPYLDKAYHIREVEPIDGTLMDFIAMKTVANQFVPWLASQTDMLAEDWEIAQ